jgi:hypothetical protein
MLAQKHGKDIIDMDNSSHIHFLSPCSLATADGSFMKTNKAQLMHKMEKLSTTRNNELPEDYTAIIDGNAWLQSLVRLPDTF